MLQKIPAYIFSQCWLCIYSRCTFEWQTIPEVN